LSTFGAVELPIPGVVRAVTAADRNKALAETKLLIG
jgi:hypothetical protein